jgi:hypothetical protein
MPSWCNPKPMTQAVSPEPQEVKILAEARRLEMG